MPRSIAPPDPLLSFLLWGVPGVDVDMTHDITLASDLTAIGIAIGSPALRSRSLPLLRADVAESVSHAGGTERGRATPALLLVASATIGWTDGVRFLLASGVDVHTRHDWPLVCAAGNGHLAVVECLLTVSGGATPASLHHPLLAAARRGHVGVVEWLIGAGADVVAVVRSEDGPGARQVLETLDAVVAAVPVRPRRALLQAAAGGMPRLAALVEAERRSGRRASRGFSA